MQDSQGAAVGGADDDPRADARVPRAVRRGALAGGGASLLPQLGPDAGRREGGGMSKRKIRLGTRIDRVLAAMQAGARLCCGVTPEGGNGGLVYWLEPDGKRV